MLENATRTTKQSPFVQDGKALAKCQSMIENFRENLSPENNNIWNLRDYRNRLLQEAKKIDELLASQGE